VSHSRSVGLWIVLQGTVEVTTDGEISSYTTDHTFQVSPGAAMLVPTGFISLDPEGPHQRSG
jgi:mannose-6-phosphate isomerase-like protein (cupin superfamily)